MAGIVGRGFRCNTELKASQEAHTEAHHQIVSDVGLLGAVVTSRSLRRHRRTIPGITEHTALGSPFLCGIVPIDPVNGNTPPDFLVIPYRRIVDIFRRRIGGGQATSKRLQVGIEQTHKVLEVAFRFRLSGGFVREREPLDTIEVHG